MRKRTAPARQAAAEVAGLHGNAARCVPVFCAYLATLMHTYSLARKQARRPRGPQLARQP